ncbi:MAG TPA: glutamate racemase [Williamwhitmania sp.]|nr:glutamate racemase [Williamwhitmania sp.]
MATIGVFDSGVGGLSVWKEIIALLPNESTLYYADNANCPYGEKSQEEVIILADRVTNFLLSKGSSMIVVACNTATAAAIDFLRAKYPVPFVGMEPAVKPAALNSTTGVIGVLATSGTFNGRLFQETSKRFASDVQMIIQPGNGLVELVESGDFSSDQVLDLLHHYIDPMIDAGADHLVLGCTHYPFLEKAIQQVSNGQITVVNPSPAVAMQVERIYQTLHNSPSKSPFYHFYASGSLTTLQLLVGQIIQSVPIQGKIRFTTHKLSD